MGKLLIGRYGSKPNAESTSLSIKDCHLKWGLKPSDFVSLDTPPFFKDSDNARGMYLVYKAEPEDLGSTPQWRAGYYLLPVDPAAHMNAILGQENVAVSTAKRPVHLESKNDVPPEIQERALAWASHSQTMLFSCACTSLTLKLSSPWSLRRRWEAKLVCPNRCQPALKSVI